jgi:hypothetical protein
MAHGLACPVKYVRLVRRKLGLRNRFYAQLVCEGRPYRKPQHTLGQGIVGLDLGPSTLAVVAEQEALLQPFCPEVTPNWQHLRRLERKLDRQRRANNPAHYDERGRVKKGKQRWQVSKRQRKVQARRREVYRRLAATRKRSELSAGPSGAGAGQHLPARAALLSGLAKAIWALGRSQCPGTVCLAPLPPGCKCWRAGDRAEHPAGQTLAALARVRLWGLRAAGPLQCPSGPFREPRNLRAEGAPGHFGLANCGTAVAGGL